MMDTVNERSTRYLTVTFRDKNNALAAPASVSYRIDCITTGTEVRAWTEHGAPASSIEITLTPDDNAILGGGERELRRVTIVSTYGPGNADQATAEFTYAVRNLRYLS